MELSRYFSDYAVLQRGKPFCVSGKSAPLSEVIVKLYSKNYSCSAAGLSDAQGYFSVAMQSVPGGFDIYSLVATAQDGTARAENVVFGDVFLCGGQSNMQYPVTATDTRDKYMSEEPFVRCFNPSQTDITAAAPDMIFSEGNWLIPKTEQEFGQITAIGYMFAKNYYQKHNVPVGILNVAVGGTHIRTFLPAEAEEANPQLVKSLKQLVKSWDKDAAEEFLNAKTVLRIYNKRVAPLAGTRIKAVLWYQGESSVYDLNSAKIFRHAVTALVRGYRKLFGDSRLPFIFSHIANHLYYKTPFSICYVNEAMDNACAKLSNCQTVPVYDREVKWQLDSDEMFYHPIHPTNKEYVALRMYQSFTRNKLFPRAVSYSADGDTLSVKYDMPVFARGNLCVKGFAVCGADGRYHAANAEIDGDTVKLCSPKVPAPTEYSYAFFSGNEMCNLVSQEGMPAYMSRSKYQDAKPDKYFVYSPFIDCDVSTTCVNNYRPDCGYADYYPTYSEGSMLSSGVVKLSYDSDIKMGGDCSLRADYNSGRGNYFRFSVRPLAFYSNSINYFALNDRAVFYFRNPSDETLEFIGILAECNNRRYIFAANDECLPQKIPAGNGFTAIEVDLTRWQSEDYVISPAKEKAAICRAEFAFIARGKGSVWLNNIEFLKD